MPTPKAPGAKKPATKRAAPRKVPRAEAQKAIAEMSEKPKVGQFRGVKFSMPSKLPASYLFDVGELQSSDGTDFGAVHRLMVGLLGAEQWRSVRDKIAADGDSFEDAIELMEELFSAVVEPYGMAMGESEASATS